MTSEPIDYTVTGFTLPEPAVAKRVRMWPLYTGLAVATAAAIALGGYAVTLNGDLSDTKQTLAATQTDLTNTQTQLTAARTEATEWQNVSEKWRLCGVATLEIASSLLDGGIFAAGIPLGTASAKCEEARTADDAMGGQFA